MKKGQEKPGLFSWCGPYQGGTRTLDQLREIAKALKDYWCRNGSVVKEELEIYKEKEHQKRYAHSYKMVKKFNGRKRNTD